jgi:HAD superfamily hydrolase (TIGR01509 family)
MTKAIIFDCFGVLTTEGWLPFKAKHFGHDKELNRQASDLNKQANSGLISFEELVAAVAKLAKIPRSDAVKAFDVNVANEQLLHYIAGLKRHYKIGMLSNAAANWLDKLFTPDQVRLFDVVTLSYEAGFLKPHPVAYNTIAEKLEAEPDECIFIDDQERHCVGAREAGMRAIRYEDFDQFKADLEKSLATDTES